MFTSQAEFLEFVKEVAPRTTLSVSAQIDLYQNEYIDRYKDSPLEIIKWVRTWDPVPSTLSEAKVKRKACIRKLIWAYDKWLDGEDEIFEQELSDHGEEVALENCRQEFLDNCAEVFVA